MSNEPEIAGTQLRSIVERIERVDEEIAELNGDKKEIYAEAKGNGYDVKVLRKVVALRKRDLDERKEEEAVLDLYLQAVGEVRDDSKPKGSAKQVSEEGGEALYEAAVKLVVTEKKPSTSHLQRRLSIGYNKAAALIERMEAEGIVSPQDETGRRRIIGGFDPAEARRQRERQRLSGSMADNKELSAEMLRDGLITPEQHAENVALSDAVATKLGAGVTVTVAGTGSSFEKAVAKAAEEAGYKVETAGKPKPLVSSFAPGRENPFSDDE